MAASGVGKSKTKKEKQLDIELDGVFQTHTRSLLVQDILKFVVNQRQLIPITYQQLQRDTNNAKKNQKPVEESRRGRPSKAERNAKKKLQAFDTLNLIFDVIEESFVYGGPIKEVILSIGATIVSPKEIYHLRFPISFHEGPSLTMKQCSSVLFRKIVGSDLLGESSFLKPGAKLSVLILAPRDCKVATTKLTPKMTYKIPKCNKYILNFVCKAPVANAELSRIGDYDFNISGIEPLDISGIPTPGCDLRHKRIDATGARTYNHSFTDRAMDTSSNPTLSETLETYCTLETPSCPVPSKQCVEITVNASQIMDPESAEDFIWYQVPVTMTGYVEQVTKNATAESIFMV